MTPQQIRLVQGSFAEVAPIADQAAIIFYEDLFARDASLRALFPEDMTEQRRKLIQMLATAVANLESWEAIAPAVRALGARHADYGVARKDYDTVAASLIATLEKGLGDAFTPETREAWLACYRVVSAEMLGTA